MDTRELLNKIIVMIYWTRKIQIEGYDGMIESVLEMIRIDKNEETFLGVGKTKQLIEYIVKMMSSTEPFDIEILIPTLEIKLDNDPKLYEIIRDSILRDLDEQRTKGVIQTLASEIGNFMKEKKATDILTRVTYELKFNRSSVKNFANYIKDAMAELEPLTASSEFEKDPAIVTEVDFDNHDEVEKVFDTIKERNAEGGLYITGWQDLNLMLQGGIIEGTFGMFNALPHNYKTYFTLSIFAQIVRFNFPILRDKDEGLKPLAIRLSFEDSLENNLQFLYQYLKANEGEFLSIEDIGNMESNVVSGFVMDRLKSKGWSIKMLRVDPSLWTFTDLFNYVLKCQSQGYCVKYMVVDYLLMMPTTGCTQGPAGVDKRDLFRRVRNFMSRHNITFQTPAQLSNDAKQLKRNGVSDIRFNREVAERGYYADCKSLDQEVDYEVYLNLVPNGNQTYLSLRRGKDRRPTTIEKEEWKEFLLPFRDSKTPILEDVNSNKISMRNLPRMGDSGGYDDSGIYD